MSKGFKLNLKSIARAAVNKTANRARVVFTEAMLREVRFPSSYLKPSSKRFSVAKLASNGDLSAVIKGRDRATSLATFQSGNAGKNPVVSVKHGRRTVIKGGFIVNLKNGGKGLAVHAPIGEKPKGAWFPRHMGNGVWLLYAPSVDQVFKEQLARESAPFRETQEFLEREFERLLKVEENESAG